MNVASCGFFNMQRERPRLEVRYHPGVGGGGADEILRPTLMCVSNGGCYRLVSDTFGKVDTAVEEEEGPRSWRRGGGGGVDRAREIPLQG